MDASSRNIRALIEQRQAILGIELGSTRIKAVLTDQAGKPLAVGGHSWENRLEDGVWMYGLPEVWSGLQAAYQDLCQQVESRYRVPLKGLAAMGVSAMMHGYLAFDEAGQQLVPFRTWRNTMTLQASQALTDIFDFNIPQRWSIAHLYQAILNQEEHVPRVRHLNTLAGYVHWQLTGQQVIGMGDASGMFPLEADTGQYHQGRLDAFQALIQDKGFPWQLKDILPQVLPAGEEAGRLTPQGALRLDPSGALQAGVPFCPPEGDAATGMVATNSVASSTGNISAGTSIFLMAVLDKALSRHYPEIDMVATPAGRPVAMVHCNNCTTDLNKWVGVFGQFAQAAGLQVDIGSVYEAFFEQALHGAPDAGGVVSYGYYSGEHLTGFEEGRPLLAWLPESDLSFANLARVILFSTVATLAIGMDILEKEQVHLKQLIGHGGLYRTGTAGQRFTAAALKAPVTVLSHAGEGGAWGIALLAAYSLRQDRSLTLEDYLAKQVFSAMEGTRLDPDPGDVAGFEDYLRRFRQGLPLERAAVTHLK